MYITIIAYYLTCHTTSFPLHSLQLSSYVLNLSLISHFHCQLSSINQPCPTLLSSVNHILLSLLFFLSPPRLSDLRFTLVVMCMVAVSSIVGPILWHLWIHSGSANANFYFSMTLVYNLAQIFLVTDVMYAFMAHQYDLLHGLPRLDKQGKPVKLTLV